MKVTFDTEADSLEDLNNILQLVNVAIQKRNGNAKPLSSVQNNTNNQSQEQPRQQEQKIPQGGRTSGGGRIVPFQDMSNMMSDIFTNQPLRRTR